MSDLDQYSELAPYTDQPRQLPTGSLGKEAVLKLRFETRGGRSILASMYRKAPLLVQRALYCDEGMPAIPWVFIITNSGGILQGDRYSLDFDVGPGAFAHVTTQAATKIHEMDANHAIQTQRITLDEGAYLEYLPDPVIPFKHSRFLMRTEITLAPSATLLYAEILTGGRKYYGEGESFLFDMFSSRVAVSRPEGRPLFVEKFVLDPALDRLSSVGLMGPFHVMATAFSLTPKKNADAIFDQVESRVKVGDSSWFGVDRLPNDAGLMFRVLAQETSDAKQQVRAFWKVVRQVVTGFPIPAEFAWR